MSRARGTVAAIGIVLCYVAAFLGVAALLVVSGRAADVRGANTTLRSITDDLARCASGSQGSGATAMVVLRRGAPTLVTIRDGDVTEAAAACMVDSLGSAPWPTTTVAFAARLNLRR